MGSNGQMHASEATRTVTCMVRRCAMKAVTETQLGYSKHTHCPCSEASTRGSRLTCATQCNAHQPFVYKPDCLRVAHRFVSTGITDTDSLTATASSRQIFRPMSQRLWAAKFFLRLNSTAHSLSSHANSNDASQVSWKSKMRQAVAGIVSPSTYASFRHAVPSACALSKPK